MKLNLFQRLIVVISAICVIVGLSIALSSCNVTRSVTTRSEYYQRGDTAVQIVTRTIESYDGSVQPELLLKH